MFKYIRGCLPSKKNRTHINVGRLPHKRPSGVMVLFYGMNFQAKYVLMSVFHVIKER